MQIGVVANDRGGHYRIVFMIGGQGNEDVVGAAIDDRMIFDPPNFVFFGFDFKPAPAMFEHLERLPVGDFAGMV